MYVNNDSKELVAGVIHPGDKLVAGDPRLFVFFLSGSVSSHFSP
jgi:hypothetical protein